MIIPNPINYNTSQFPATIPLFNLRNKYFTAHDFANKYHNKTIVARINKYNYLCPVRKHLDPN
jgi:hypothetical protein